MARILIVTNTDFFMRLFLEPLVTELARRGHAVELCCDGRDLGPVLSTHRHHDFTFPSSPSPAAFLEASLRMRRLIRKGSFAVVNSHNRNASIVARLAAAKTETQSVYTANGYYFNDAQGRGAFAASMALEAALARVTALTLSQTQEDAEVMGRLRLVSKDEVRVIGNGVDLSRFQPIRRDSREDRERRLGLATGRFRFIAVGRIVVGKGFQDLLEAFSSIAAQYDQAELVQLGGNIAQDISPFEADYARRVEELGLQRRVLMTGMTDDVPGFLSVADVYVTPSYWEGLSRSLLEAMAVGLPVLATRIRGAREVIREGETGYMFPPGDVDSLTALMRHVLEVPAEHRFRMGSAARSHIERDFELGAYTQRQADAIESVLRA